MAITFHASASNSASSGNNVTLTIPAFTLADDLVIVAYSIGDDDDVDHDLVMVTSGYTQVADLFSDDGFDCHLGVFYKFMGVTPDVSAAVDGLGGSDASVAAVCMVFRGVDLTTPMDVTATTATGLSSFNPNPPEINHNNPSGVVTVIAGASAHSELSGGSYTFPTGYTTNKVDIDEDDTVDTTVGMGYNTAPADPENPGAMTHSGTTNAAFSWCAVTMALRPAAAAGRTTKNTRAWPLGTEIGMNWRVEV